jgi:hypothetical protein
MRSSDFISWRLLVSPVSKPACDRRHQPLCAAEIARMRSFGTVTQLNPDSRSQPKSAGTKAQFWSSEGVRLRSFKAILRSRTPARSDLSILINAALIDEC